MGASSTLVEGGGTRQAGGFGATDELRVRGEVAERLASQHALRREAAKDLGATLSSNLRNQFASGADRHRGFKDHQQVVVRAGDQRFGRANECLVGDAPVVANQHGYDDKCNVGVTHRCGAVDGGAQAT